jgi:hypothetical protein
MKETVSRKMLVIGLLFLFLGASATLGVSANLAWSDNFDSYANDQFLDGGTDDGGWKGWNDVPAAGSYVRDDQAFSTPHAIEVAVDSDTIHEYTGYTSGQWTFKAMQYIPVDFSGMSYFIMMSQYAAGDGTWVVQVHFDSELDLVESEFNAEQLPIIYGEWTEIRCEIDLDGDWLEIYYGGELLAEHAYSDTVQGTGGGPLAIACVDLFANAASIVYYDDISLLPFGAQELTCDAGGPYAGDVDEVISFTGTAYGGTEPYTWAWDFGDGETANVQNPTHAYAAAGEFTVTLTVTDAESTVATDTATATITEPQEEPIIVVDSISGGIGVKAVIKNIGTGDATGVAWEIALDGKLIFLGKSKTGTVDIPAGGSVTVKSFVIGFGATNINVTAADDAMTKTGKVLLFFVTGVA